jgi:hypothetical protein
MWIEDTDGLRIVLVEVPADHPLRVNHDRRRRRDDDRYAADSDVLARGGRA